MNAVCGYLWMASALYAGALSYRSRQSAMGAALVVAVTLAAQTGWAFVLLGLVQSMHLYPTRADVFRELIGPALGASVVLFWWHLLCWRRDSNTTNSVP